MKREEGVNWLKYIPMCERAIKKQTSITYHLFSLNFAFRNRVLGTRQRKDRYINQEIA